MSRNDAERIKRLRQRYLAGDLGDACGERLQADDVELHVENWEPVINLWESLDERAEQWGNEYKRIVKKEGED